MILESVEDSVSLCCMVDVWSECSEKLRILDYFDWVYLELDLEKGGWE